VNFLAHLVLSPGGEKIMAGNFFADRVRGSSWKSLEADYAQGVLLHRRIDHFTDQHPLIREAKQLIDARFGLFRGVLLDVFWDHFLALDFARHTDGFVLPNLQSTPIKRWQLMPPFFTPMHPV
jgi:acyl carrier protein phosphodiesterase